jgi:hypothetical protein
VEVACCVESVRDEGREEGVDVDVVGWRRPRTSLLLFASKAIGRMAK